MLISTVFVEKKKLAQDREKGKIKDLLYIDSFAPSCELQTQ